MKNLHTHNAIGVHSWQVEQQNLSVRQTQKHIDVQHEEEEDDERKTARNNNVNANHFQREQEMKTIDIKRYIQITTRKLEISLFVLCAIKPILVIVVRPTHKPTY